MSVVGVDFGNQNVLIAAAGRGGVDVILNGNSQRLNPYVFIFYLDPRPRTPTTQAGCYRHYYFSLSITMLYILGAL